MNKNNKKIIVAMSGGVDSSTVAFLLQKKGYKVIGIYMRLGISETEGENAARQVCEKLKIKFYPINLATEFKKEIINYFLDSYKKGLTPNPCVKCNKVIKFKKLLKLRKELGADYLATGHYICLKQEIKNYKLFKGKDLSKDQSYFLYSLNQKQLAYILFPLGKFKKDEVRKIANKEKLPYLKKESQDICFLSGDHNNFLRDNLKLKPGKIEELLPSVKGSIKRKIREIGKHQGLPLYTIGQRKGVEIGGIGPFYVAKCDYKTNILYVVKNGDDPALYSNQLIAKNINWISGIEPKFPLKCEAKIRYGHKAEKCIINKKKESSTLSVQFNKPQRAITAGQSVVFYGSKRRTKNMTHSNYNNENEVLGGGIIG